MEQKNYWNSVSDTKQFTTPFQSAEFGALIRHDAAILDVGCGYGRTLEQLHQAGYTSLTGLDFSEGMIARGNAQYPHLNLQVMQPGNIPFPDETFDAVILFAVLTCIISDAEQAALIREIRRVLKPGGILYINDFLLNSDDRNLQRYEKFKETYGTYGVFELPEGAVLRHQSEEHLQQLLSDYAQLQYEHLTFTTMNGHTSNGFFWFGRKQ